MSKRFLFAATALAAVVPTLALAQARPAQPQPRPATPPAQQPRPAAQQPRPAARPAGAFGFRPGSIELTGSVGAVYGSEFWGSTVGFGGFGRLGYNITDKLGVSAGAGYVSINDATVLQPFAGITYTMDNTAQMSPFLTAGVQYSMIQDGFTTDPIGGHVGVGIRRFMQENLALRVEARGVIDNFAEITTTGDEIGMTGQAQLLVGVSYFMGGGPPRDTDADGVPDRRDGCANTPRGATVDARGCPQDTDRDGVFNGLDRCTDTPANTPVDANGCTRDADRDGIADNTDRCPNTPTGTPVDANGCPRDADGDSVSDNLDRCANTPRGTPVETTGDRAGCPRDADGDGVLDPADRCPSTATGTPVDANGCPRDADSDGVHDGIDRCANTAAGTQVDATGCPVARDADTDGVIDANDRCPATPAGRRVDANGCPLAEMPAQVGQAMVLRNVTFASGTNRLTAASRPILDQIATAILATPNSRWEIGGHTDSRGSVAVNNRLSQRRAQAVVDYLITKGVSRDALVAVGYGPRNPIAPNTTLAGRAQNRRVEVKRLQ